MGREGEWEGWRNKRGGAMGRKSGGGTRRGWEEEWEGRMSGW